jgi:hypothetical protein
MSKGASLKEPQKADPAQSQPPAAERLAFTFDAAGQLDQVEAIDASGVRRDLSRQECSRLAEEKGGLSLEAIVEKAFVAGIDYVLGEGGDDEAQSEAERVLLRPMLKHSSASSLVRPEVLRRALVADLVRRAASRSSGSRASSRSGRSTGAKT